ncbi:GNAT family N-acetyltransferase [Nocardia sp. NPDC052254]|uniref:GNAT family N-acetyltransferase n=1 Tax=Nocardia sp. NPDC052254 TaxID=3155681 RepID=UPI003442333A
MTSGDDNDIYLRHYNADEAQALRAQVRLIFQGSYIPDDDPGDAFASTDAFMHRFDSYTDPSRPRGFELVVAWLREEPMGQAWGWPLGSDTHWWSGLQLDRGDVQKFVAEDGNRTFALSEIMVRNEFTGRGLAHTLHDELLSGRGESRATLLVRPANERAYGAYRRWGWSRAGTLRPAWPDAPHFDVLVRDL